MGLPGGSRELAASPKELSLLDAPRLHMHTCIHVHAHTNIHTRAHTHNMDSQYKHLSFLDVLVPWPRAEDPAFRIKAPRLLS